jgi:threonine dehydratase
MVDCWHVATGLYVHYVHGSEISDKAVLWLRQATLMHSGMIDGRHDITGANAEGLWTGSIPTLADVFAARAVIRTFLKPTPLLRVPALSEKLGCELLVKVESLNPTGAFKVRGGLNYMSHLGPEQLQRGVVGASTGNHGQSIAYAAQEFGTTATIFVPEGANPLKVEAMSRLGADVIHEGADFDECLEAAREFAAGAGRVFIHSANEPHLIAGVATHTLEILDEAPEVDTIFVATGGGSGLCGACIAGKGIKPDIQVYGVQSEGAPVIRDSLRDRRLYRYDTMSTFAEGIATREAFSLPARILWEMVDDIEVVSDAELRQAMLTLLQTTRVLAEGAGAAGLAGAWKRRSDLVGRTVAVIVSGGNVTLDGLAEAMEQERAW